MKKIKISVLMSVYCKEKPSNLKLALESIINQSYKADEIILVEDGSLTVELDKTIDDMQKRCNYLNVIKLEKNVGLGNALNEGLKYCNNKFVARMDSDDISELNRFKLQIDYITKHPEIDVLGGNILEFDDETGKNLSYRNVPRKCEEIKRFLKRRNPMNHVTVMFKKEKVEASGGYLDCLFFEDYYLWARMLKNNCIFSNLDDVLVKVRAGLSMAGRRGNINYIKSIIVFEKRLLDLKLINFFDFLYNISVRSTVSLMPNKIRYYIYQRRLRNEKN